jgi:hypothetical protein
MCSLTYRKLDVRVTCNTETAGGLCARVLPKLNVLQSADQRGSNVLLHSHTKAERFGRALGNSGRDAQKERVAQWKSLAENHKRSKRARKN